MFVKTIFTSDKGMFLILLPPYETDRPICHMKLHEYRYTDIKIIF